VFAVELKQVQVYHVITTDNEEWLLFEVFLGVFDAPRRPELRLFMDIGDVDTKE